MLKVIVTSRASGPRVWNVEPYGDDVTLREGDVLAVDVDQGPDVLIEIDLSRIEVGDSLSLTVDGLPALPTDLRLNGSSLWPDKPLST